MMVVSHDNYEFAPRFVDELGLAVSSRWVSLVNDWPRIADSRPMQATAHNLRRSQAALHARPSDLVVIIMYEQTHGIRST